jgi:hypothetical protein
MPHCFITDIIPTIFDSNTTDVGSNWSVQFLRLIIEAEIKENYLIVGAGADDPSRAPKFSLVFSRVSFLCGVL